MVPSKAAYDLIKGFEGFRARPYYCIGGKLTIGYGTTRGVKRGMTVTHEQAMEMLERDVVSFSKVVNRVVKVPLNQNQFDALVSFVYNIGEGRFITSTLLRVLNRGRYDEASKQFLVWNKITVCNKVLQTCIKKFNRGLYNRRVSEKALFDKPINYV